LLGHDVPHGTFNNPLPKILHTPHTLCVHGRVAYFPLKPLLV